MAAAARGWLALAQLVLASGEASDRAQHPATTTVLRRCGIRGTVHLATVCAGAAPCVGAGQQQVIANASPSRSWMQWMHRGAQHARAAPVALMMAAEALCTQGDCTLVHRMQWQCSGCCCSWMARTRTSSCLQVAMPHARAQQPATATVLRSCGLQGHCAPSDSVHWCCARRWALASTSGSAPSCIECNGNSVAAAARGWLALAPARACKW